MTTPEPLTRRERKLAASFNMTAERWAEQKAEDAPRAITAAKLTACLTEALTASEAEVAALAERADDTAASCQGCGAGRA